MKEKRTLRVEKKKKLQKAKLIKDRKEKTLKEKQEFENRKKMNKSLGMTIKRGNHMDQLDNNIEELKKLAEESTVVQENKMIKGFAEVEVKLNVFDENGNVIEEKS